LSNVCSNVRTNETRREMSSERGTVRRFVVASAIVAVVTAAFVPSAGFGSSAAVLRSAHRAVPARLAHALDARFGARKTQSTDSPTEHPGLGYAVAMSADGTTALVGAPGALKGKGAVYVYHVADAGSWTSSATPMATLAGTAEHGLGEYLGISIALSADGTTAFVGAPFRAGDTGAVIVFHVADETAWTSTSTPTAVLTHQDGFFFGEVGLAVSADGTTLVAGDWDYDNGRGGAFIYHVSSEDAWASTSTPTATLTNAAAPAYESVGYAVAISGDGTTVLVSDILAADHAGSAYVYHAASSAAWLSSSTPTAILTNASGAANDFLGAALAFSSDGTTAFLGAPGVNAQKGAVDVFHVAAEPLWAATSTPTAILTNGTAAKGDFLGESLAVSGDGKTVVAGASYVMRRTGAAYVFHASGEDTWASSATPAAALSDSAGAHKDGLGISVATAADGATVLLGAPYVNWLTGQTDVFHTADPASWQTSSSPTARLTNSALPKPLCVVPNIKGFHIPFAKELLDNANCRLGKVKRIHSTRKNRKLILSQSPAPKRHLPPGSKVSVKIGR
jgi:hypothetical protein